ncbi:hypothetical protein SLEP1_g13672 [Rubroshorea leprosula]|uniref:Uncharacterized protein n=1 Tax=Rubroshorea leprosula TaxID=152421 RepID=A0AAV5IPP0_9ROSI|nr:hypothetical protein SLEP1_g13672 [Rubroshorea leprosula]
MVTDNLYCKRCNFKHSLCSLTSSLTSLYPEPDQVSRWNRAVVIESFS